MNKLKFLVVEDEAEPRVFFAEILRRRFKAEVQEAARGREAIELIKANDFDLVVLDLMMPEVTGKDVISAVKKEKELPDILVVTAYDAKQIADEIIEEGAVDYMPKPADAETLLKKIEIILRKKKKLD